MFRLALLIAATALAPFRLDAAILDNSFFIEEAYNQEARVVQHVQTIYRSWEREGGAETRAFSYGFTQEWPLGSQRHQLSYTIPYARNSGDQEHTSGIEDIQVHYRLQAFMEGPGKPAIAPRVTLILPTGDSDRGLGAGTPGVQLNLPASRRFGSVHLHANAGVTIFPEHDLTATNLGLSAIFLLHERFNLMLEVLTTTEEAISGSGETEKAVRSLASPGFRYAIDRKSGAQWVFGAAAPIGLSRAEDDFGVFLYTSFEHPF